MNRLTGAGLVFSFFFFLKLAINAMWIDAKRSSICLAEFLLFYGLLGGPFVKVLIFFLMLTFKGYS